jgi:hypothetical protein
VRINNIFKKHTCNLSTQEAEAEEHDFKDSLSYRDPISKNKTKQKTGRHTLLRVYVNRLTETFHKICIVKTNLAPTYF